MTQTEMKRPRIGIPVPTSERADYNRTTLPQYAAAIIEAGGEPVELPLTLNGDEIVKRVADCQGILLPGSPADVNPAKYGQVRQPETADPDPAREMMDELLLQEAYRLRKPLLTICYGMQSLNCWKSGTLVQDLRREPVDHRAKDLKEAHSVLVEPASKLAAIVGTSEEISTSDGLLDLPVNSSHHQAIDLAGKDLRVIARCSEDDVVESIQESQPNHFVLGVQWHPERTRDTSQASRRIFRHFVEAAAAWRDRPNDASMR